MRAFINHTTGDAEDRKDRVIYDSASGELFYDANGSKKGGSMLVATLDDTLDVASVRVTFLPAPVLWPLGVVLLGLSATLALMASPPSRSPSS